MKFILTVFVLALGLVQIQAQSCHAKSATAGGGACCSKSASAAIAAADQSGILVKKDVATGDLSFHKPTSCSASAQASYVEVKYDATTKSFVNKAPEFSSEAKFITTSVTAKKMDCSKMTPAECAEKMAKGECQGHAAAKATLATN